MLAYGSIFTSVTGFSWLLDIVVKSAILLSLAGVVSMICRHTSAAQRHLIWTLAVMGVLLLPLLSAVLPVWHIVRLPGWRPSQMHLQPLPPTVNASSQETSHPIAATPTVPISIAATDTPGTRTIHTPPAPAAYVTPSSPLSILPWYLWVTLTWSAGCVLLLAWWGYGYALMRHILSHTRPASEPLVSVLAECTGTSVIRLLMSEEISTPVVVGVFRATILLPLQTVTWPTERCRVVLQHELAHVQRRDLLIHLLTQIACALYWVNPFIWIVAHRMRIERETACDDAVLGTQIKASDYAAHLLAVARVLPQRRFASAIGIAMARSSKIGQRIGAVLDGTKNRAYPDRVAVLLVGTLTGMLLLSLAPLSLQGQQHAPTAAQTPPRASQEAQTGIPANLHLAQPDGSIPTFIEGAGLEEVVSPSGHYLATHGQNTLAGEGLFVYDAQQHAWYRLSSHSGKENMRLAWLPDETGIIASYGWGNQQHPVIDRVSHFTWYCHHLNGTSQHLTALSNCIDWALIPDGSGIVTTVIDEQVRQQGKETEVRCRVKVFDLAQQRWRDTGFLSPWIRAELLAGNNLALRRKDQHWVLSFWAGLGPLGSQSYWVDLDSGQFAQAKDDNPPYTYSPDGRYAVDDHAGAYVQLFTAKEWPQPTKNGGLSVLDQHVERLINGMGEVSWSADSRTLVCANLPTGQQLPYSARIYDVYNRRFIRNVPRWTEYGRIMSWAGLDALVFFESNHLLQSTVFLETMEGKRWPIYQETANPHPANAPPSFTYFDIYFITRPRQQVQQDERQKIRQEKSHVAQRGAIGMLYQRRDALQVAQMTGRSLLPTFQVGEREEIIPSSSGGIKELHVITRGWNVNYRQISLVDNRAQVVVIVNGHPWYQLTLERPFGEWWYVTGIAALPS